MTDRDLDVVLFGATGYVGRLTAEHLAAHAVPGTRIGLAGRNEAKLKALREELGDSAAEWALVTADVDAPETLRALAEQTTVVATTVGPYVRHGLPLVAECAAAGTHYADLTGEVVFVRRAIDAYHDAAVASGARIVNACGFDAMPSDLGVLELHRAATANDAGELTGTEMVIADMRGGISGGTVATIAIQFAEMRSDSAVRKLVADPYALSPDRDHEPDRVVSQWKRERDPVGVKHDTATGRWLSPFVMSTYNTRIVRRSNALLGHGYGSAFRYQEWLGLSSGLPGLGIAVGATLATGTVAGAMLFGPTRSLITSRLPAPGEGPSEHALAKGRFRCEFTSRTTSGQTVSGVVAAHGDPGYGATAVMFAEAALALALDGSELPDAAGVLTPATGIGAPLVSRLRRSGFTLTTTVA